MVLHPDYPNIEFKPAIARYDWDQTYDVLEFVYLPQGFDSLMGLYGIPAFELMAIDRFTPYSYIWAEGYSDYVYNFLKKFNFSPDSSIRERHLTSNPNALSDNINNINKWVLDIPIREPFKEYSLSHRNNTRLTPVPTAWDNRITYKLGDVCTAYSGGDVYVSNIHNNLNNDLTTMAWRKCSIIVPAFTSSYIYHYEPTASYPLQLTEGEYCITFLVEQGEQEGLTGSITTINQVVRYFRVIDTENIDINKIINNVCQDNYPLNEYRDNESSRFCANSIVLSKKVNGAWQLQTVSSPNKFLFYADIDTYFSEVSEALIQYFTSTYNTYRQYQTAYAQAFGYSQDYTVITDLKVTNHNLPINVLPPQSYIKRIESEKFEQLSSYFSYSQIYPNPISFTVGVYPTLFTERCCLTRANNNKWGGSVRQDVGISNPTLIDTQNPVTNFWLLTNYEYPHPSLPYYYRTNYPIAEDLQDWWAFIAYPRGTYLKEYSDLQLFLDYNLNNNYHNFFTVNSSFASYNGNTDYTLHDVIKKQLWNGDYNIYTLYDHTLMFGDSWINKKIIMKTVENNRVETWEYGINPLPIMWSGRPSPPPMMSCEKVLRESLQLVENVFTLSYLQTIKAEYEEESKTW